VSAAASLFDVSGRSALVTGATGAFGAMAARTLAGNGANLTLAGANSEKLERLGEELASAGAGVECIARRPGCEEDTDAMVEAAVEAHGGLDIVVAAAGMNRVGMITEQSVEDWQAVMDANVRGSWLLCRSAGRQLLEQGRGGKIVLVSSTRGRLGHPAGYSAYCPSKAAVDLLARTLACEWGRHRITVNAIAPTVFRSDLTAWMYENEGRGKEVREAMLARIPLGRLGEPEDFAGALLFFSSPASDFCTGQVLYVDGGYTAG
jgi:NAD(P)-dependent dehydrogenase (short-subunit alcohol dehydrogenase family)